MAEKNNVSRRKFLVRGGLGTLGVLTLGTYLARNPIRRSILGAAESIIPPYNGTGTEAGLWFELTRDNRVLFHSPKVEMGSGCFTAFGQMIAEEMDLDIDQVIVQAAPTTSGVIDGLSTGGSLSVASLWQPLRELAATMREMLKAEAASRWNVDPSTLTTARGIISGPDGSMTYAQAAEGVAEWKVPDEAPEPKTTGFRYIGQPTPRIDLKDKVFGAPIFGLDAGLPDLLYASITRPEIVGARFKSADTDTASNMPGVVKIVQIDDWIGVIAQSYPQALAASEALNVEWEFEKLWTEDELRDRLRVGKGRSLIQQKDGSALSDSKEGTVRIEFTSPIGAHAQIEPNGAIAHWEGEKLTIILSTQVVGITRQQVAKALKLKEADVNIVPTQLGGGFGRRLNTNHAIQAAQLAQAVGKPVKYIFTRQEEFQHDLFRPPTHHIMKGRLNDEGYLDSLEHHYASGDVSINSLLLPPIANTILGSDFGASRGALIMYDALPNRRVVQWHTSLPFATSWWRSLGLMANAFAIESFIDEMALRAGKNPIDFRLPMLGDDPTAVRIRKVIELAAEKANYRDSVVHGRAMGFAASIDANSAAAQVAEVSIERGQIRVHKVTCAFDCGLAVNPDQVRAQCEGSIIMGISASLFEKMTLREGALYPTIYGPYEMALMRHAPREIDVHLIQGAPDPLPVGEPPLGPIAPAVANAVRRLTGIRLTDIPLQQAYEQAVKDGVKA